MDDPAYNPTVINPRNPASQRKTWRNSGHPGLAQQKQLAQEGLVYLKP
jgi:hypothetical protein